MKDFINWLGVSEKAAKVVVWLFIIMIMLITINASLDSLGFTHYQITYDNLKQINETKFLGTLSSLLVCVLNFYCIVLLVFRIKEAKKIFKYALLYTILNWLIVSIFNYGILQAYIVIFITAFCYLYSNKNWKYIIYTILAFLINTIVQGIAYFYKAHLINFSKVSAETRFLLSIDYFIIMAIIILVKEIYLKKRGENKCQIGQDQVVGYGGVNSKKKQNLQKKSPKK